MSPHPLLESQFTPWEITETMLTYGGGFVQALARCFRSADEQNQRRLVAAFREEFQRYADMRRLPEGPS